MKRAHKYWANLRDALREIALASFPLLLIPFGRSRVATQSVARSYPTIVLATFGRGGVA